MASKAFLITIIVAASMAPAFAMEYMVGDASGWNVTVDYTKWAAGKEFHVGDSLMFMYTPGVHNVLKVSGADFKSCNTSNALGSPYTTGNDTIALDAPGKRWYICGFGTHCSQGMKLVISVTAEGPAPAPAPISWAPAAPAAGSFVWIAASVTAAFWMIMT